MGKIHWKKKEKKNNIEKTRKLLLKGYSAKEISKELNISIDTIKDDYFIEITNSSSGFFFFIRQIMKDWKYNKPSFFITILITTILIGSGIFFIISLGKAGIDLAKEIGKVLWKIIEANIGNLITLDLLIIAIGTIMLYGIISFFYYLWKFITTGKIEIKSWVWGTIGIMILFMVTGLIFINQSTTNELALNLNDEKKNQSQTDYQIKCQGESQRLIYDSGYECIVLKKDDKSVLVENVTGSVLFKNEDKLITKSNFKDEITFAVPNNTSYVLFNIYGKIENKSMNLSSGYYFNFIGKEEEKQIKKEFLNNLFLLFTLVFFSIPTMMVSFKHLAKKE